MLKAIADKFPEINSLLYVINTKLNDSISDQTINVFKGLPYIVEEMEGLKFRINAKSFYQTNSRQAYQLYSVVRRLAFQGYDTLPSVYDLYTGTGTIANFVARKAKSVVGIEYVEEAIEDAKLNSDVNGLANTKFFAGDMKDILTDDFIAQHGKPEIIITDPPRAGMHEDVINVILNASPKVIVYVSCNPATQARDLAMLDVKYRITDVCPVDMFPQTHHVENVVRLELKQE
jgi:23S rRNA (uracil1939-C5)-methyltransferase